MRYENVQYLFRETPHLVPNKVFTQLAPIRLQLSGAFTPIMAPIFRLAGLELPE